MRKTFIHGKHTRATGYTHIEQWILNRVQQNTITDKRLKEGHSWVIFRCNDCDCPAELWISEDAVLAQFVGCKA